MKALLINDAKRVAVLPARHLLQERSESSARNNVAAVVGRSAELRSAPPPPRSPAIRVYFNAQEATTQILQRVDERDGLHAIAVDLGATGDLDVTATDLLSELYSELQRREITLLLAQVKGIVRDRMRRTGLMAILGEDHVHATLASAVAAATPTPDGTVTRDAPALGGTGGSDGIVEIEA
jgi:MFS superfamily sulfate permease-like transporter